MITERPVHGRPPGLPERASAKAARAEARRNVVDVLRAYVALTKPRIVELLLVTTVPAMMLAAGGWPDLGLVAVVLVGGALSGAVSGGGRLRLHAGVGELPALEPAFAAMGETGQLELVGFPAVGSAAELQ